MNPQDRNRWITLPLLAAVLFIKSLCYRRWLGMDSACGEGQLVSAYLAVTAVAFALATLAWLPRRFTMITLLVLADLWLIAGIWYYEANGLWLSWHAIRTITELRGFAASIFAYLSWRQMVLPLTTLCGVVILFVFPVAKPSVRQGFLVGAAVLFLLVCASIGRLLYPLSEEEKEVSFKAEQKYFVYTHSPLAQVGAILAEAGKDTFLRWRAVMPLSVREQTIMSTIYGSPSIPKPPQGHLVYILVESLETWAMEATTLQHDPICPCLNAFISTHNVLYVREVETQQIYGRSGDGQLITQTGLLPLSAGVACQDYGENSYPNLAHFYADGVVLNPYRIPVWNQRTVTYSYGFKHLESPRSLINQTDSILLLHAREYLSKASVPTAVLALTIDTHTPFRSRQDSIPLPDTYSRAEQDYLRSVHYTDRQIGRFLAWADTAATMRNATIVITADHNHFPRTLPSAHSVARGYCPFILLSPQITHPVYYPRALQMDLFPTVIHAIDQTNYAWHGLGIDLLSTNAKELPAKRPISVKEAYALSDKLIRCNFFMWKN